MLKVVKNIYTSNLFRKKKWERKICKRLVFVYPKWSSNSLNLDTKSLFKETEDLLDGGNLKSGIPWVKVKRCRAWQDCQSNCENWRPQEAQNSFKNNDFWARSQTKRWQFFATWSVFNFLRLKFFYRSDTGFGIINIGSNAKVRKFS